ncbi:RH [Bearded dragon adenovirus 1]|uniref:RH n=1 Tax=Bearded dragon adenovirus 1 TaxID=2729647 RepID=A0A6N3IR75_9ADEN|nr:RH [Bearded dragon adenovirus 1]QJR83108.1 RH [Bearded dragon adenovirus 1]
MLDAVDIGRLCIVSNYVREIVSSVYWRKKWRPNISAYDEKGLRCIECRTHWDNCPVCTTRPHFLSYSPERAGCFCSAHMKVWSLKDESVPIGWTSGPFSRLPTYAVMRIMLCLSSRDMACLAIAYPGLKKLLRKPRFLRAHVERFRPLFDCFFIRRPIFSLSIRFFSGLPHTCLLKQHTLSHHCPWCLVDPYLLTMPARLQECYCVDHIHVGDGMIQPGVILWDCTYMSTDENRGWPTFGFKTCAF